MIATTATVVIPVRNDPAGLRSVLTALSHQTLSPDEVVIVNAAEHPLSIDETLAPSARVLAAGPALPGAARNLGASAARNHWIVFLDAGTQPVPGWLEAYLSAAAEHPEADVLFGCYEPSIRDSWDWSAAATYLAPANTPTGCRYPTTASLCVRRDVWERLGGMREDLRAGEDLLFFETVARAGCPTVFVPGAKVVWDLPEGPCGHFKRLRAYSRATWPTPLARRWQIPVLRMYVFGVLLFVATILTRPVLVPLLAILPIARAGKNYSERRRSLDNPVRPRGLLRVLPMLAISDAATLLGVYDAVVRKERPRL